MIQTKHKEMGQKKKNPNLECASLPSAHQYHAFSNLPSSVTLMSKQKDSVLNPRTTSYEFLGPPGALLISIGVPVTTYALYFGCSEQSGGCPPTLLLDRISLALSDPAWWKGLWDTQASLMYLGWYAFCVAAWAILPGDRVAGTTLRTGGKKMYKINGTISVIFFYGATRLSDVIAAFSTLLLALGLTCGVIYRYGPQSFTFFYEKFVGFITASVIMSVVQGVGCYAASFRPGAILALGGNSGNPIYDVRSIPLLVVSHTADSRPVLHRTRTESVYRII
jgi:hypothetical protein